MSAANNPLDGEEQQLLQRKRPRRWAASLGVEVSFFLIDESRSAITKAAVWAGKTVVLRSISCCFDEFYRTAVRPPPGSVSWGVWCRATKKSITTTMS